MDQKTISHKVIPGVTVPGRSKWILEGGTPNFGFHGNMNSYKQFQPSVEFTKYTAASPCVGQQKQTWC
jgi:hypothetical protein